MWCGGTGGAGGGAGKVKGRAEVGVDGADCLEEAAQVGVGVSGGVEVVCFWCAGREGRVEEGGREGGDLGRGRDADGVWVGLAV